MLKTKSKSVVYIEIHHRNPEIKVETRGEIHFDIQHAFRIGNGLRLQFQREFQ